MDNTYLSRLKACHAKFRRSFVNFYFNIHINIQEGGSFKGG